MARKLERGMFVVALGVCIFREDVKGFLEYVDVSGITADVTDKDFVAVSTISKGLVSVPKEKIFLFSPVPVKNADLFIEKPILAIGVIPEAIIIGLVKRLKLSLPVS